MQTGSHRPGERAGVCSRPRAGGVRPSRASLASAGPSLKRRPWPRPGHLGREASKEIQTLTVLQARCVAALTPAPAQV